MPKLVYQDPESGQEVTVEVNDSMPVVTIGRNPGNIVRVNNPSISRQHAKIVWEDGACTLFDLDSSNGSYVNGNRVRSQQLENSDRLRVGEFPVEFFSDEPAMISADDLHAIPEMEETPGVWADGTPKSKTNLGGFGPFDESDEESIDFDAPLDAAIEIDESEDPVPSDDFANDPLHFIDPEDLGYDSNVSEAVEAEPQAPSWASDSDASGSVFEPEDPSSEGAFFPRSEPLIDFQEENDAHTVDDSEIISEQPSVVLQDEETFEASLEELNLHLQRASDVVDDDDFDPVESLGNHSSVAIQNDVYEQRILELEGERDELLDLLQTRAGDVAGASKVQIERLRSERDRLIDERRRLQRQIEALNGQLQSLPAAESIAQMELELGEARQTAESHQQIVDGLKAHIEQHESNFDRLTEEKAGMQVELEQYREAANLGESAAASVVQLTAQLEEVQAENAQMTADAESFDARFEEVQQSWQQALAEKESLGSAVEERDGTIERLQHEAKELEQDIGELQSQLSASNEESENLTLERDGLATELESRPPSEEVQQIVSELATTRASLESALGQIEELQSIRDRLVQEGHDQRGVFEELQERFGKQGAEFEATTRERDALKTEKGAFSRETDYLLVEKRALDSEVRALKKQLKDLDTSDRRKKTIFDELRGDLERIVTENNALVAQMEKMQESVDTAPSRDELDRAVSEKSAAEVELADAIETARMLEKNNEDLSLELGSAVEAKESLSQQIENANIELDALRDMVSDGSDATSKIDELEKANKKLKSSLKKAEKDAAKNVTELESLSSQLADREVELLDAKNAAQSGESDLSQKVNRLEGQLLDAEQTLSEIILERDRLEDELNKSKN